MKKYPDNVELEFVNCPNGCVPNDELLLTGFDRLHGIPGEFTIYRCVSCRLERTTPRPTPATIGAYYPSDYAPYKESAEAVASSKSKIKEWLRHLLGFNARALPPIPAGRMLEIGCSSGGHMEQVRHQGWQVEGIEFSDKAASVARSKGFNVQTGSLEQARAPEFKYDVITAWMVLEHLHQPIFALQKLREWIKADGYLVALVPDAVSLSRTVFKGLSYDVQVPTHLFHYTPKTLKIVLENAGWELERVFWQRNCNTLLWSFEYWAKEKNKPNMLKVAKWLRLSKGARRIRIISSFLLGVTRQSGRIEIWARPAKTEGHKG
jgi:2-polyprenyl-3-methyl-5-hydroxy-6-metoxy-1,4-benzoquinol methylase